MKKLFFTLLVIATSMISFADDHKEKKDVDMKKIKSELGYWEAKDCKAVLTCITEHTEILKPDSERIFAAFIHSKVIAP